MRTSATVSLMLRLVLYATLVASVFEGLVLAVGSWGGHQAMRDDGPIELLQLAVVFATGVVFWLLSRRRPARAELLRVLAALAFVASARELDNVSLELGWRSGYVFVAMLPVVWAAATIAKARARFLDQAIAFSHTPSFALLVAGFLVVVVYAQLIGQKALWMAVLAPDVYRPIKEIVEESSELLGYLLLFFGAVEAAVDDGGRHDIQGSAG